MKDKINVAELLRDCPSGMELDCTMYEDVYFDYVDELNIINCYIQNEGFKTSITFNQHGTPNWDEKSKCVIFPKGKTTWWGFQRPFKDGDVIYNKDINALAIFYKQNDNTTVSHCFLNTLGELKICHYHSKDLSDWKFATEEEKQKLFQVIKYNGYWWNHETKTLDKLVEPKFNIGDKVKHKFDKKNTVITITGSKNNYYYIQYYNNTKNDYQNETISFTDQDKYELIIDKFDVNTLKPFDKVLMRSSNAREWVATFYSHYSNNKFYGCGMCCYQCIPYEENKHLLGTTDDCKDYFKTWQNE